MPKQEAKILQDKPRKKRVVVAGMGPGGLVAAIEAFKKGYEVHLFDNRDYFTRGQRISLADGIIEQLRTLVSKETDEDRKFFDNLKKSKNSLTISELQEFLFKQIPQGLHIYRGSQYSISEFDFSNKHKNLVTVKKGKQSKKLEFDYFVAADGAKRTMAKLFSDAMKRSGRGKEITYSSLKVKPRQIIHGAVGLRVHPPNTKISFEEKPAPFQYSDLPKLRALGWTEPFPPRSYVLFDKEKQHFFVGGEIPESISNIKDEKEKCLQLTKWAKLIMAIQHKVPKVETQLVLDTKPRIEAGVSDPKPVEDEYVAKDFPVVLKYTDTPYVPLEQGTFVSIGDATMNANFLFGHGANDAIGDGTMFAACLPRANSNAQNQSFDADEFIKWQEQRRKDLEEVMEEAQESERKNMKSLSKEYLPKVKKEILDYGQYLLKIAKPLETYDAKFKQSVAQFEKFLSRVSKDSKMTLDELYISTITFSESINNNLDKLLQVKQQASEAKIMADLKTVNQKIKSMESSILGSLINLLSGRSKQWKLQRENLEKQKLSLEDRLKWEKDYAKRMGDLKKTSAELLKEPPKMLHGYMQRLAEKGKRKSPSIPAPAIIPSKQADAPDKRKPRGR